MEQEERTNYLRFINDLNYSVDYHQKTRVLTLEETLKISLELQSSIKIIENNGSSFEFRVINENKFLKNLHLLTKHNMLYVVSVANEFTKFGMASQYDLIQEGYIGLYEAALRYDPNKINPKNDKEYKFLTFARWWIRQAMLKFMSEHSRTVQLPANVTNALNKINKVQQKLFAKFGFVDPYMVQYGTYYLDKKSGIEFREFQCDEEIIGTGLHPDEVHELKGYSNREKSIDVPSSPDDDSSETVADTIYDASDDNRNEDRTEAQMMIHYALNQLDERDRNIVMDKHGIGIEFPMDTDDLAKKYNCTTATINNILRRCIECELPIHINNFKKRNDPDEVLKHLHRSEKKK